MDLLLLALYSPAQEVPIQEKMGHFYFSRDFLCKFFRDMDIRLIKMFGVTDSSSSKMDVARVNSLAMQLGYIVEPEACRRDVWDFLHTLDINTNSTFYKHWNDVLSKSRMELLIDQITHYALAYGCDIPWTPNDNEKPVANFTEYTLIRLESKNVIAERCYDMICSGIALDSVTSSVVVTYIAQNIPTSAMTEEWLDKISNKEALAKLCASKNIFPTRSFDILRYMMLVVTGDAMIIKSPEKIKIIKLNADKIKWDRLSLRQYAELAKIFYRFKSLFLAMRETRAGKKAVNKIRRMAKKFHTPMYEGFWESVVNKVYPLDVIERAMKEESPSNFKVLRLMQAIREKMLQMTGSYGPNCYIIRNGKVWVDKSENDKPFMSPKYEYWSFLYDVFENYVVNNLKSKACTIRFPEHLTLACPTSEKMFFGNIPFGSYFALPDEDAIFGVHWDNKSGIRDIDLSFVGIDGRRFGWNAGYYDNDITYSGDVTYPDPEATELMWCKKGCKDGILYANLYSGDLGTFDVIFAQEKPSRYGMNYMVKPENIKVKEKVKFESSQQQIGVILDGDAYITNLRVGNQAVSNQIGAEQNCLVMKRKMLSTIPLKDILIKAGFKERLVNTKANPIEIDLRDLQKDTLIRLFS